MLDEKTKQAFVFFRKNLNSNNYWETENWKIFQDYLLERGFEFVGSGTCSLVYKYPDSKFIIKFNHNWDNCIGFYKSDNKLPNFLKYPIFCEHCAIQPFADCSKVARNKASEFIQDIMSNIGMYKNRPVLIDSY